MATLGLPGVSTDAARRLGRYLGLLADWSRRVNLTGARTDAERLDLLVRPAVEIAPLLPPGRLIDVGSGNGSPGLVLAALRPESPVALLEPRARRWAFLREAARAMDLPRVDVQRARHDGYAGPPAEVVTLRALSLPLAGLAPLVAAGGTVVVLGNEPAPQDGFSRQDWSLNGVHAYRRR